MTHVTCQGSRKYTAHVHLRAGLGLQEGQGLGKSRQGIVAPLVAQKTAARSGVIVVGKEQQPSNGHQDKRARAGPALQVGVAVKHSVLATHGLPRRGALL